MNPRMKPKSKGSARPSIVALPLTLCARERPMSEASDVELLRSGPSYTIDTILHFKTTLPVDGALFFILGIDAFLEIDTWKNYRSLLEHAAFVVMSRPGNVADDDPFENKVVRFIHRSISRAYCVGDDSAVLHHPELKPIYLARVRPVPAASSEIRQMVRHNEDFLHWVDPAVARYIHVKGLYR